MSDSQEEAWSPARAPYTIAVSQSWWAFHAAALFASDARRSIGLAQQIYARQIFGHLRGLRRCAEMQAGELRRLGIDEAHRTQLDQEITRFDEAVPAARSGRDMLEHFDDYARGEGRLQRKAIRELGLDVYEAAAMYWGGGYDPMTEELTEGPSPFSSRIRGTPPSSCTGLSTLPVELWMLLAQRVFRLQRLLLGGNSSNPQPAAAR